MSATRTACEEAMTVLEEVIMFTFQQSVYYLTKVGCHPLIYYAFNTQHIHTHTHTHTHKLIVTSACFTSF